MPFLALFLMFFLIFPRFFRRKYILLCLFCAPGIEVKQQNKTTTLTQYCMATHILFQFYHIACQYFCFFSLNFLHCFSIFLSFSQFSFLSLSFLSSTLFFRNMVAWRLRCRNPRTSTGEWHCTACSGNTVSPTLCTRSIARHHSYPNSACRRCWAAGHLLGRASWSCWTSATLSSQQHCSRHDRHARASSCHTSGPRSWHSKLSHCSRRGSWRWAPRSCSCPRPARSDAGTTSSSP